MLPKVSRDDLVNHNFEDNTSGVGASGTNGTNKIARLLSAAPNNNYNGGDSSFAGGVRGALSSKGVRRPISTKAAILTTIPLEPVFLSPQPSSTIIAPHQSSSKPYLPYSATSARQNSHRVQLNQQQQQRSATSSHTKGKGDQNGFKSEYSSYVNRSRAQSHRTSGKTWNAAEGNGAPAATKRMPYLVPKHRISSSTSSSKQTASSDNQQRELNDEKVCKKPEELQTSAIHLIGGMIMTGTGKAGTVVNGSGPISSSLAKDRVQVCRTKEEREKNPDTIRLDKRGVRVFPDIGGGESATLKLLSLQHNLITRLENVPLLTHLVVLDLYDNRIERICGLQGLPSLRVLLLGKNRIKRIEGLDSLKRLEILDFHGNQLRYVDNLGSLSSLRVLNLAGNLLRNIRNLGPYGMSSLTELNLKRNRIKNLDGLQKAPHLKKLLLANNDLQNISTLAPLRKLFFLNEMVIDPNPLIGTVRSEYHNQILTLFPNLGNLDRNPVTEEMKQAARLWHKKKLEEEECRKMEEERIRQEMVQTVGPPGSREQVIYQARRRWESLRNFVKSSNNNGPPSGTSNDNNAKKTTMKSMKKVVTVATEVKAKKQAELLYPPATLDLEEFPVGQDTLDRMESLMSCEARVGSPPADKKQQQHEQADHAESHISPNSQDAIILVSKSDQEKVENDELFATPQESSNANVLGGKVELQQHQWDDNQLTDSQCPSVCSARSSSAKVAVVRPLIHRSPAVEDKPSENIKNNALVAAPQYKEFDETVSSGYIENNVVDLPTSTPAFIPEWNQLSYTRNSDVVLVVVEDSFLEKLTDNFRNGGTGEVGRENISNSRKETEESTNEPQLMMNSNTPTVVSPLPQPNIDTEENKNDSTVQTEKVEQQTIRSESARVKSKLLKHLRSVSLDSYPHPFLRPGYQKCEDAPVGGESSVNSASPMIPSEDDDDDGVGEEDDDNDNEVIQDYECEDDDAYSIATSTCTTVTSGSTPRRSSTVVATTNRLLKNGVMRKQAFPRTRSQRIKLRDRAAKLFGSTSDLSPRSNSGTVMHKRVNSGTGTRDSANGPSGKPSMCGRILRRCDSAASLSSLGLSSSSASTLGASVNVGNNGNISKLTTNALHSSDAADSQSDPSPYRKQGMDFLVEIEGKMLNVFGQGGLRHALTAFASNVTCHVITAKFHYISYDSIIPFFGKLRQVYPSLEHFHFRANNLFSLAQLDALSDLQGLTSLFIAKEGNPIVNHEAWAHYSSYRLSHWGLQIINGKEVSSEYRGGASPAAQAKGFESLGFLALSCLPQTALTPLAKRLHMLHCFCCCSPSTSSDESNRRLANTANQHHNRFLPSSTQPAAIDHGLNNNFCTAWDDDPVLLDVIGKEALVYCPLAMPPEIVDASSDAISSTVVNQSSSLIQPPTPNPNPPNINNFVSPSCSITSFEKKRAETLGYLVDSGVEIVEKVDMLEKTWPTLMTQVIQEILMDFRFMDSYMKKELKKCQDITLINQQQQHNTQGHHWKKIRH